MALDDRLVQVLKPLHPRVFDIATPAETRKALGEILREIESSGREGLRVPLKRSRMPIDFDASS
jgi:hypothetical protein